MAFRTNAAPYQRAKRSTLQIMIELCIALALVWIAAVVYTFMDAGSKYGIKSILMMVISLVVTAACDVVTTLIKHKKGKGNLVKEIVYDLIHNYSYVTAIIFTLTLPVWASYYVVIMGSIFATVVVKNLFGGFGKNIFNPAIMARIFVGLCFMSQLSITKEMGFVHPSIDAASGSTITTIYNGSTAWLSDLPLDKLSMKDLFFGSYFGAMGETFTILILVIGVVLSIRKVINWRTPVFYLGTVVVTSFVIALVLGFENPLTYVGYHIALGGLAFGAVFMITDPVTGPTSMFGKSLIGVIAGLLTVLIRVKGGYPEGVMYSIAICNLISPAIDYLTVGKSNAKLPIKYGVVFGSVALSILLCTVVSYSVNGGKEVYAINGITLSEYQDMTENKGFTLKEGHELAIAEGGKEAYFVVDATSKEKVAVVYEIKDIPVTIPGEYEFTFNLSAYVAISMSDDTVYEIAYIKGGSNASYEQPCNKWTDENLLGKDAATIDGIVIPYDGKIGATYSANKVKNAVAKAFELYALEYSK